jgi:AraC-like DNA-binding protein
LQYREQVAAGAFGEFAICTWTLEQSGGPVQRVVPDGCAELIFNLGEPLQMFENGIWRPQPRVFLAGQITGPLLIRPGGRTKVVGVRLRPEAAGRLFGMPMQETAGRVVPLVEIAPALSLRTLEDHARRHGREDLLVREAVRRISAGPVDIGRLARDLGASLRQFERRFLDAVGLSPKLFSRMRRFQTVFRKIDADSASWAAAASSCGYYDQAHLIRDFREFAGEPPDALLRGTDLARHFLEKRRR